MQPVSDGVRAYFAPVNRTTETPSMFDPAAVGLFNLDSPPAPWIDAGWVDNFVRTAQTKVEALRIGADAAVNRQFRTNRGAAVELEFREWGKLQMALACGAQHMNVLADAGGTTGGSSGAEAAAVALQAGSTAQELMVGPAVVGFAVGDIVAVDQDYQQQTGYVGTGIAGTYVPSPPPLAYQADYIRRITFNVGRVAALTDHSLHLDAPLLGGVPASTASVQKVAAFVDREGGNFFQEWSALFVLPETSAGRVCFYYPRLQGAGSPREGVLKLMDPWRATTLHAAFEAMAWQDSNDGETVYCYRIYFPPSRATLY
jgi:hypothetical protein